MAAIDYVRTFQTPPSYVVAAAPAPRRDNKLQVTFDEWAKALPSPHGLKDLGPVGLFFFPTNKRSGDGVCLVVRDPTTGKPEALVVRPLSKEAGPQMIVKAPIDDAVLAVVQGGTLSDPMLRLSRDPEFDRQGYAQALAQSLPRISTDEFRGILRGASTLTPADVRNANQKIGRYLVTTATDWNFLNDALRGATQSPPQPFRSSPDVDDATMIPALLKTQALACALFMDPRNKRAPGFTFSEHFALTTDAICTDVGLAHRSVHERETHLVIISVDRKRDIIVVKHTNPAKPSDDVPFWAKLSDVLDRIETACRFNRRSSSEEAAMKSLVTTPGKKVTVHTSLTEFRIEPSSRRRTEVLSRR
ncbi:MAG TPA: hypothetical protein VGZ00_08490 [Candidatus Baltobacteraceae bacterium]|jgi:hypothetical protein|nr:hypothetical protein [Candidatus Baltobacteraceae bacterium]